MERKKRATREEILGIAVTQQTTLVAMFIVAAEVRASRCGVPVAEGLKSVMEDWQFVCLPPEATRETRRRAARSPSDSAAAADRPDRIRPVT